MDPEGIAYPVRSVLRRSPNVQFVMAEVGKVGPVTATVEANRHTLPYDFLVLSPGSTSHYFGVPGPPSTPSLFALWKRE